jgi:hypothetical protein
VGTDKIVIFPIIHGEGGGSGSGGSSAGNGGEGQSGEGSAARPAGGGAIGAEAGAGDGGQSGQGTGGGAQGGSEAPPESDIGGGRGGSESGSGHAGAGSPGEGLGGNPASPDGDNVNPGAAAGNNSNVPGMEIPGGNADPGTAALGLPDLSITQKAADIPAAMVKTNTADWTVAIELGATLPGRADQPRGEGVENQLPQLLALAKETEGKSINFVVHAERVADPDNKPIYDGSDIPSVQNAEAASALQQNKAVTERYFIHDGKIDELPTVTYGNAESDIVGLLQDAGTVAPSEKLGLVIQSHGGGKSGVDFNIGSISLGDTRDAIATGLTMTDHQKLDLLDFDGCDMAEAKVISSTRAVANDVVASSAYEIANSHNDGQNLQAGMRALLADPTMTAGQFGDKLVQQAASGVDGVGADTSMQTLTNFDLTKYDNFDTAIGDFGTVLGTMTQDPANMKIIRADIDGTTAPATGNSEMSSNERDLRTFAQKILADGEAGHFSGDVKPLEDSARAVIASIDSMVTSTYGDKGHNYDTLGGVTAELPGSEILDSKTVAHEISPVHKIDAYAAKNIAEGPQLDSRDGFANAIDTMLINLPKSLKAEYPDEIQQIETADNGVRQAQDVTSYRAAIERLHQVTSAVDKGPMGQAAESTQYAAGMARYDQKLALAKPVERLAPNWTDFVTLERLQNQ